MGIKSKSRIRNFCGNSNRPKSKWLTANEKTLFEAVAPGEAAEPVCNEPLKCPGRLRYITAMLALEVDINGKRRCLAGIPDDGVISAILSWVGRGRPERGCPKENARLHVGGLDSLQDEHMDWLNEDLAVGDDVRIRIVDVSKVDRPIKGSRRPAGDSTRHQKAYVRRLAKQFGWKIVKDTKAER